jgi:hypothetical protein
MGDIAIPEKMTAKVSVKTRQKRGPAMAGRVFDVSGFNKTTFTKLGADNLSNVSPYNCCTS